VGQLVRSQAKEGGAAVKARLGKWIGTSTATGTTPSGAPGLGLVEEPASDGLRMGSAAAKTGTWGRIGDHTAAGASHLRAPGLGPVEEPANGGARVGEVAAAKTGFRE